MKTRMGFVSNSSSSSFIVAVKSKESQEALTKHNNKLLNKSYGKMEQGDEWPFIPEPGQKILTISSIEYGAEEDVENMLLEVLKGLGFNAKDIIITIGE